jgi:hypothetical protein
VLTIGAFDLAAWVLWATLMGLGLVSSLKRTAERITERHCARRRLRRARAARLAVAAAPALR